MVASKQKQSLELNLIMVSLEKKEDGGLLLSH